MYNYTPYFDNQYFLAPYWQTGEYVPPEPVVVDHPESGSNAGGFMLGSLTDAERKLMLTMHAHKDDKEVVEILTMIVQSGAIN